jgi:hypothetical protein
MRTPQSKVKMKAIFKYPTSSLIVIITALLNWFKIKNLMKSCLFMALKKFKA